MDETRIDAQDAQGFVGKVFLGDCVEGMKKLPAGPVDLVITDPPFAIDFKAVKHNYNRTGSLVMKNYAEVDSRSYGAFTLAWMEQAARLLKDSGSMFVFSGWNNLKDVLVAADDLSLTTVNHIVWKYQFGVVCKKKFVTSHYHLLYLCKDDKRRKFFNSSRFKATDRGEGGGSLRYKDLEDVWVIKREYWHGDIKTATKLPAEIIRKILSYASEEGDLVLDPFMGSGQVAVVAREMKRRFTGFEISAEHHAFAMKRLNEGVYRIRDSGIQVNIQ